MEKYKHLKSKHGRVTLYSARISNAEFVKIALAEGSHREPIASATWNGVATHDEAIEIQRSGYIPPAGVVKLPAMQMDNENLYMERAVIGQFPDVAAYLRGEPESMYNMVFDTTPTPTIHLACMMNVTAGIRAESQQQHADAVYNCIRALQAQGNQVTLTALFFNNMSIFGGSERKVEELQVEIVSEGQVLSAATLGARFHLSYYRVAWFAWANFHFENTGGSIKPPAYVDAGKRLVIPSFEFMPEVGGKKQSVAEFVTAALRKKGAAV
jgi:hypothetical protein